MNIYNFHPVSGEYISTSLADESPLEPGIFLIPAYATDQVPPIIPLGKQAVFSDSWSLVSDNRGITYWLHGTPVTITELGVDIPPDALLTAPSEEPTQEQIVAELTAGVQAHLDATAMERGYDGIVSASSYAGAPNPFQAEGIAYLTWRAAVWSECYVIMDDVKDGLRQIPTILELIDELPKLVLP